jgi:hypothetical protein
MAGRPPDRILHEFVRDSHALTSKELCQKYRRAASTISEWRQYCRGIDLEIGYGPKSVTVTQADVEFDLPDSEGDLEAIESALLAMNRAALGLRRSREPNAVFRFSDTPVMIVFWGDWHIGSGDLSLFLEDLQIIITTPGIKFIGMGDYKSNLLNATFRTLNADLVTPGFQDFLIIKRYAPQLRETALGYLIGCHDYWDLFHNRDFVGDLAQESMAKHLGHFAYLELLFPDASYRGIAQHKPRRESGLNTTNAQRALYENEGNPDFIAVAHKHFADLEIKERRDGGETVWIRSGSYLIQDEYGQRIGGYWGEPIFPGIIFLPDREQMLPYRDFKQGLPRLSLLRKLYAEGLDIDSEQEYLSGLLNKNGGTIE